MKHGREFADTDHGAQPMRALLIVDAERGGPDASPDSPMLMSNLRREGINQEPIPYSAGFPRGSNSRSGRNTVAGTIRDR